MATNTELAQEALANCKPSRFGGDCLIWQGPKDDKGYGYIHVGSQRIRVHRLIKLYGVERTAEQTDTLKKLRLVNDCPRGLNSCVAHWRFTSPVGAGKWESADDLRGELERAGYL